MRADEPPPPDTGRPEARRCPACDADLAGRGDAFVVCPGCGARLSQNEVEYENRPLIRRLRRIETVLLGVLAGLALAGLWTAVKHGDALCFVALAPGALVVVVLALIRRVPR